MDVRKWRQELHMSQRQFSKHFGIPLGTVRNWEQGVTAPPEYLLNMLRASIRRDDMINIETIKFVKMLDDLAELTEYGIDKFANATGENYRDKVFYDENTMDAKGERREYRVVLQACLIDDPECLHHDVISYYDSYIDEYTVRAVFDGDEPPYIEVRFTSSDTDIVIEDGRWYFT